MAQPHPTDALAALGYRFVPGTSGDPSDWVLRQTAAAEEGFAWRGQDNYDLVGATVSLWVRAQLTELCGLEEIRTGLEPAAAYGTPGWREHDGALLLLVCGNTPGGEAGVWGRALCINATTLEGAMFDYIARARRRGWAVVVADPHGEECPQRHLVRLYSLLPTHAASRVHIVGHSYGGSCSVGMIKSLPSYERIASIALTDGMGWGPTGWSHTAILTERLPGDAELEEAAAAAGDADGGQKRLLSMRASRDSRAAFAELAPAAYAPPTAEVCEFLLAVGVNWVSSEKPLGAPVVQEGACMPAVSAGHVSHPSATYAATVGVFEFLDWRDTLRAAALAGR